jgi:hypothetical protein
MMSFWLTWKLFGNGRGLASPYLDDVFYWLDGRFYHWIGGLGAQLASFEWTAPKAGTRRKLLGKEFVVFIARRRFLLVEVSWALTPQVHDYAEVEALRKTLLEWRHGTTTPYGMAGTGRRE